MDNQSAVAATAGEKTTNDEAMGALLVEATEIDGDTGFQERSTGATGGQGRCAIDAGALQARRVD
jgi:hypothetical protein